MQVTRHRYLSSTLCASFLALQIMVSFAGELAASKIFGIVRFAVATESVQVSIDPKLSG